jgi:hypothetical protein
MGGDFKQEDASQCRFASMTRPQTSPLKRRTARSIFTNGSAINGRSCSRIPRTPRPSAPLSSAIWRGSSPSSPSAAPSSSASASIRARPTARCLKDIEETQGGKVNYPIIADSDLQVSKLYNMLPAEELGTSEGRTASTNQAGRSVFVIGPDQKIRLTLTHGPQFR